MLTPDLRDFQTRALEILNQEEDSHLLCISPTGSGKSRIFQEFCAAPERRTLIISPLVALGRQHQKELKKWGIVTHLGMGSPTSGPPVLESDSPTAWIVSPERLFSERAEEEIKQWCPNFLVVDECHTLWDWGECFREDFKKILPWFIEKKFQKSLWLTATFPRYFLKELETACSPSFVKIGDFDFPENIHIQSIKIPHIARPFFLLRWINHHPQPGIVFCSTRKQTERVAGFLSSVGKSSVYYHGALSSEERRNIEQRLRDSPEIIIIATSAFGMGMDFKNLEWVVLWDAHPSILDLAQKMGRIARDGRSGQALLLWDDFDLKNRHISEEFSKFYLQKSCKLKIFFDFFASKIPQCKNRCDYCSIGFAGTGSGTLKSDVTL